MIYIYVAFYSAAYSYLANIKARRIDVLVGLFPVFLLLVLTLSFQQGVGTDYHSYLSMAKGDKELGWIENKGEILFVWLNEVVIWLGVPQLIFLFTALIQMSFLVLIVYEIKKLELKVHWFFLLYFIFLLVFFNSFNGIRQYTAVYVVVYSFFLLHYNKRLKFSLVVLFASLFHSTAIYFFPLVLFGSILRIKIKFTLMLSFLLFLACLSFADLSNLISYVIQFTDYSSYLNSEYFGKMDLYGVVTKFPKIVLVVLCGYLLESKYEWLASKYRFFLNLSYVALMVLVLSFSSTLIWRMYQYFDFFTAFPLLILLSYSKQRQLLYFGTTFLVFIYVLKVTVFAKGEYLYNSLLF